MKKKSCSLLVVAFSCLFPFSAQAEVAVWEDCKSLTSELAELVDKQYYTQAFAAILGCLENTNNASNLRKHLSMIGGPNDVQVGIYATQQADNGTWDLAVGGDDTEIHTLLYSSLWNNPTLSHKGFSRAAGIVANTLLSDMKANPDEGAYVFREKKWVQVNSPLGYAVEEGLYNNANLLLKQNADPDYSWDQKAEVIWTWEEGWPVSKGFSFKDSSGWFALKSVVLSQKSKEKYPVRDRLNMIYLLSKNNVDLDQTDNCGLTAMTNAVMCATNHRNRTHCPKNFTPADYKEIVAYLVQIGAKKNVIGEQNSMCSYQGGLVSTKDVVKNIQDENERKGWQRVLDGKYKY